MLVVVSPAKKLDFETPCPFDQNTECEYLDKSKVLIKHLKKLMPQDLEKLFKVSSNIAELNFKRFQSFKTPLTPKNAKQAASLFKGDTYVGLGFDSFKSTEVKYAQNHLRILSGLYGIVKPLDLIAPYRLEMGTRFKFDTYKNLYEYWKEDITEHINSLLKKEKYLINCASNEYFDSVNKKDLNGQLITPVFKENKNGKLKIISFNAKRARGMMANYIIKNKIKDPKDLIAFNQDGYKFDPTLSSDNEYIFVRN